MGTANLGPRLAHDIAWLLIVAIMGIAAGTGRLSASVSHTLIQQVSGQGISRIWIGNDAGDVSLSGESTSSIKVQAYVSGGDGIAVNNASINASIHDGTLSIMPACSPSSQAPRCSIKLIVTYPKALNLRIRSHVGDIKVVAPAGTVVASTTYGSIIVTNAHADASLESNIGDIRMGVDYHWMGSGLYCHTDVGNVEVLLPTDFPGKIEAHTIFGHVHNELTSNGEIPVTLVTRLGNIAIRQQRGVDYIGSSADGNSSL